MAKAKKGIISAFTLFADDIRQEIGGKDTIVGVYSDEIQMHEFPAMMPKLATFTRLIFTSDTEFPLEASFSVKNTDGNLLTQAITLEKPESTKGDHALVQIALIFSPMAIPSEGTITFSIEISGQKLATGGIRVVKS